MEQGASEEKAEEIASRTVNKEKARARRVAHRVADVDARPLVLGRARRPSLRHEPGRRAAPRTSSTTRPGRRTSRAARR